jgi:hypothetical protein
LLAKGTGSALERTGNLERQAALGASTAIFSGKRNKEASVAVTARALIDAASSLTTAYPIASI